MLELRTSFGHILRKNSLQCHQILMRIGWDFSNWALEQPWSQFYYTLGFCCKTCCLALQLYSQIAFLISQLWIYLPRLRIMIATFCSLLYRVAHHLRTLDPKPQDVQKIPKWSYWSYEGQFCGLSNAQSYLVVNVHHQSTDYVSPQYHLVFDHL